ncbi:MAG: hypothetical protein KAW51_05345 [Candidatus Lokiarchaeota archaeon]|nr:hypothetical protein [Candidatus Lokiarchaeota archaeon]
MRGKLAIIGILGLIIGGASVGGVIFALAIGDISTLRDRYDDLDQDYSDLEQVYTNLTYVYNNLTSDYNDLFGDYQSLSNVIEDPLTNPVVPTYSQVESWLASDDTDTHDYVNKTWVCGDFATMLMVRAKEMNWRMRIAVMFYSFSGEAYYGTDDPYGSYGHAFNMIHCQDGNDSDSNLDIYYIEPQTDAIWYVSNATADYVHYNIYTSYTNSVNGTVWGSKTHWVNHYSYFA